MSASDTITASATMASTSTTVNLFPTTTRDATNGSLNQGSPTTYYFVFLGVLVVLLIIAASLAYRALRIRRQFRSATQIALMRGEPPPRLQDDYWALGVLSPWRMEDAMRNAAREARDGREGFDPDGGFTSRRGGKKTKWDRMPVLYEWEVSDGEKGSEWRDERDDEDELGGAVPVSLQSLDPPAPTPPPEVTPMPSGRESLLASWRRDRSRTSNSNRGGSGSGAGGGSGQIPIHGHERNNALSSAAMSAGARWGRQREMDRELYVGEEVRAAVIIQMPHETADHERAGVAGGRGGHGHRHDGDDGDSAMDDWERPGWKVGMELGVWEGRVGQGR